MKHAVITFLALYTTIKLCKISAENYKLKRQLQAEEIFYNIIPICHTWTYKQDKRIKQFKYVWRQESEDEK